MVSRAHQGQQHAVPDGGFTDENTVYDASECVGTVVAGICHGSILPNKAVHPICHGEMVNGQCTGPLL